MTNGKFAILLDVDGPLNPYAAKATRRPEGFETHRAFPASGHPPKGYRLWLNPLHGPKLLALGGELIWATTWEDEANEWIGPHIGLPKLEVIDWIDRDYYNKEGLYWKTKRVAQWMNENRPGIPFLWLDDEVGQRDKDWIEENCAKGSGIRVISPRIGIADDNLEEISEWKNNLEA
jgi:hypothetical protein